MDYQSGSQASLLPYSPAQPNIVLLTPESSLPWMLRRDSLQLMRARGTVLAGLRGELSCDRRDGPSDTGQRLMVIKSAEFCCCWVGLLSLGAGPGRVLSDGA